MSLRQEDLALYCRSLSTLLQSGVSILKAFEISGRTAGVGRIRRITDTIQASVSKGSDVATAMPEHGSTFPPMMTDMVGVAEQSGALPEVLHALAEHYDSMVRLKKQFVSAIALPIVQLVAAIFIIAGLILIMGMIGKSKDGADMDVLKMGLVGERGALIWLGGWGAILAVIVICYLLATRVFAQQKLIHTVLLGIPVLGPCLRAFAIARFSWAFALTQDAGMKIGPSLAASMNATGNWAFSGAGPGIERDVLNGDDLSTALNKSGLFPQEFIEMVIVGETSGTVPETLKRISPILEDQARRRLAALTTAMAWLIWLMVAALIIFLIFRVFSGYLSRIEDVMPT